MVDQGTGSDPERQDFIEALAKQRGFLVQTVTGLSEEQARLRPTVSTLCLGGLIKHVTRAEQSWTNFLTQGTAAIGRADAESFAAHAASFRDERRRDDARGARALRRGGPVDRGVDPVAAVPRFGSPAP